MRLKREKKPEVGVVSPRPHIYPDFISLRSFHQLGRCQGSFQQHIVSCGWNSPGLACWLVFSGKWFSVRGKTALKWSARPLCRSQCKVRKQGGSCHPLHGAIVSLSRRQLGREKNHQAGGRGSILLGRMQACGPFGPRAHGWGRRPGRSSAW